MRILPIAVVSTGLLLAAVQARATTPPKPDLRCSELSVEKVQTMEVPLRVRVHLAVKNFGPGNSESYVARLSYRKGASGAWTAVRDYPLPFSPPNGGAEWNPTVDLPEGGSYTFKVEVDVNGEIAESSEGNNVKTVTKTFSSGTPDLTVANLDARITHTTSSGTVTAKVSWDVTNTGDGKAAGSFVTVLKVAKNNAAFVELSRYSRSNLEAGASFHYTATPSFTSVTRLKFRIEADAGHVIAERSNANNTAESGVLQP
jgi:subtilase family serine protease